MDEQGIIPTLSLQQRMRVAREHLGLTQAKMARQIGISRATYASTEQGVRQPRPEELATLAAVTGISQHWLETGEVPEAGEN